jgi:hypothetical protein
MFLEKSAPNQRFIYYSGYIFETLSGRVLGKEIYLLAQKGLVYLAQKKSIQYYGYDYFIIKASKRPIIKLIPFSDTKLAEQKRTYVYG